MVDVFCRIQPLDAERLFHVLDGGDFEFLDSVIGVAAVFRFFRFLLQDFHHPGIRHLVRFPDSHIEQFLAGVGFQRGPFGAFDFLELVYFGVFAELVASQASGKQVLNITFVG